MRLKTLVCAATMLTGALFSQGQTARPKPQFPSNSGYGRLPLLFEANRGQSDSRVKFISRGPGYRAYLTSDAIVLSLRSTNKGSAKATAPNGSSDTKRATISLRLVGAASNPAVMGEGIQPGRVNYFIGNHPSRWQKNVPMYRQVRYKDVYPGIDLVYYGTGQQLEYDFSVAPNSDVRQIQFEITGVSDIHIGADGALVLRTPTGEVHFQVPAVYQEVKGARVAVDGKYSLLDSNHVGFQLAAYDKQWTLVIDPVLAYSTYLAGSGDEQPSGIAVDADGYVYVVGTTDSIDFPLGTIGSLPAGSNHVYVAKLDQSGSELMFLDYLGGSVEDDGFAIALDSSKNIYVTGSTASDNFPVVHPFQGTYPGAFNAFLSKLSADGSSLLYSTYFGGSGSDLPYGVAVDQMGNMVLAGYSSSKNLPTANAFQPSISPNQGGMYGNYGFLTKFSADGASLIYSTYFAGTANVAQNCGPTPCWVEPYSVIVSLASDATGNVYVTGYTNTYDFPTTEGAYEVTNATLMNSPVGFLSKFSSAGSLQYSTYFYGGSGKQTFTYNMAVAVDEFGSAYIAGATLDSATFPVTTTSICDPAVEGFDCTYAFVTKFDSTGATLLYSTFLGPHNGAFPRGIALDGNGDAFVVGSTADDGFTSVSGIEPYSGGTDILLAEVNPSGTAQLIATYIGGSGDEDSAGLAIDSKGSLYVAGSTSSPDLPTTPSAFQSDSAGNLDSFVLKIEPVSAPGVVFRPRSLEFGLQSLGTATAEQSIVLKNMGSTALSILGIRANGDFSENSTCASSLPAAGSCTISVSFTPTTAGLRTGLISIEDDADGSPHVVALSGLGDGSSVTLIPAALSFNGTGVGSTSTPQSAVLQNTGTSALSISAIAVEGDFSETNNCGTSLPASGTCAIAVSFSPTKPGSRVGSVSIQDNAQGSPHVVALTGVSGAPAVTLVPGTLTFSGIAVGSTSATQIVTLTNSGDQPLTVAGISVSGNFGQTNNCPLTLPAASSCTINASFTPAKTGANAGTITITDNTIDGSQTVSLNGTGTDFNITGSATTAVIKAGATATYSLQIGAVGGAFNNTVMLSCSGVPQYATCTVSPSALTPGPNGASFTLSLKTTGATTQLTQAHNDGQPPFAAFLQLQGLGIVGIVLAGSGRGRRNVAKSLVLGVVIAMLLVLSACAGGTVITPQTNSTPSGSYAITVSGVSGALQHSLPLSVTVQ
jgi:hypothetical protein